MSKPRIRLEIRQKQSMSMRFSLLLLATSFITIIAVVIFLGISSLKTEQAVAATTYITIASGNWTNASVWSTNGISSCSCTPGTSINDRVIINHNLSTNANLTINSSAYVTVSATGKITSNNNLNVSGTIESTGSISVKELLISSSGRGVFNGPLAVDSKFLIQGEIILNSVITLSNASMEFKPGSIITAGADWKINIANGNINNEGVFNLSGTCLRISNGNFDNKSGGIVNGSGYIEASIGNVYNSGIWSSNIAWCAGGTGSGLSTSINCDACMATVLPITLINFNGVVGRNTVVLNWATASESNNDYFTLQRSVDAINYIETGRVKGAGNSNMTLSYVYEDDISDSKNVYYRLFQTDFDGTTVELKTISVKTDVSNTKYLPIKIFPNPVQEAFTAQFKVNGIQKIKVNIVNVNGSMVFSDEIITVDGVNIFTFSRPADLKSGTYLIRFTSGNEIIGQEKLIYI